MKLLVVAPCLLASSVAYAQAPGETPPSPAAPPPVITAPPSDEIDVMRNRFSVGVGFSAVTLSNDSGEAELRTVNVALRFRAHRNVELEFELFGGRQSLDGEDGPLAIGGGHVGARYRFLAGRRWNGYLGAGIGQVMVEHHETTDEMLDGSKRSLLRLAGGLEHRWRRFSVGADLAVLALGERADHDEYGYSVDAMLGGEAAGGVELGLRAGFYF